MQLYSGFDLHSNNCHLGIIDESGKRIFKKKLSNEPERILQTLQPYRQDLAGVVVESTYNWYWLVDLLMAEGYRVHLANPAAIQMYKGIKHVDDTHDAFWLAEMLRLNILPEGLHLSERNEADTRSVAQKRTSGAASDLTDHQPAEHCHPQ